MLLETKNIRISFSNSRKEVFCLLDGVDMTVPEGTVTTLIGGNGAGKTTLFNVISGFETNFTGQVMFDGQDISRYNACRTARIGIGRLFQGRQLMSDLSLMDNMKIAVFNMTGGRPLDFLLKRGRMRIDEDNAEKRAIEILMRLFGKGNKYLSMLDRKVSELSYGEQRLLAIARLLMCDYRILLLDEPTSGVNPRLFDVFKKIIRDMVDKEGKTVLMIEHNMSFVRDIADECYYLTDGRILSSGPTRIVLDNPIIRNNYLGL